MAAISIGRALGAGFVLIKRRPVSVFVWGLLVVLFVEAPLLAAFWLGFREGLAAFALNPAPTPSDMQAFQFDMQQRLGWMQVLDLPVYLVHAVVVAAVFRAVLEPKSSAFAYLRLGARELWLLLAMFCFANLLVLTMIPALGVVAVGGVLAVHAHPLWARLVPLGVAALAVCLLFWVGLRLSMAAPMTFAERRFRLFESWSLTRGQSGRLLILVILTWLIVAVLELLAAGVVWAVVFGLSVNHVIDIPHFVIGLSHVRAIDEMSGAAPWLAIAAVLASIVFGMICAVAIAPFASAYSDLKARGAGAHA